MGVKKPNMDQYWINAAKQMPWTIDIERIKFECVTVQNKFINVPSDQWSEAKEHLTVQHLIKQHGFVLQDCIPYETKPDFHVEFKERIKPAEPESEWSIGKRFRVKSTKTRLEIISCHKDTLELKYPDGEKFPFKTPIAQVEKSLNLGVWERI